MSTSARIDTIDMKAGMPAAEEARRRLAAELQRGASGGVAVLKLVHGYGSTGKGGRIRRMLRTELTALRSAARIGTVVPGEAFSVFDADTRGMLDRYPALRNDPDLERGNAGVTFVELRRRGTQ